MPFIRSTPPSKSRSGLSGGIGAIVEAEKLMQIAFVLPASVAIGLLAGWGLSHLLHQKWIEIAGIVFGCISGLFYVIQTAFMAEKKSSKGDQARAADRKGTPNPKS